MGSSSSSKSQVPIWSGGDGVRSQEGVCSVPTPAGAPTDGTVGGVTLVPAPAGGVVPFPVSMVLVEGPSSCFLQNRPGKYELAECLPLELNGSIIGTGRRRRDANLTSSTQTDGR